MRFFGGLQSVDFKIPQKVSVNRALYSAIRENKSYPQTDKKVLMGGLGVWGGAQLRDCMNSSFTPWPSAAIPTRRASWLTLGSILGIIYGLE